LIVVYHLLAATILRVSGSSRHDDATAATLSDLDAVAADLPGGAKNCDVGADRDSDLGDGLRISDQEIEGQDPDHIAKCACCIIPAKAGWDS
jgi:hypothetical protein